MMLLKRCRAGFTLIELLVVMAIISVLVSMTLPALQSAYEAVHQVQCANNLKQMGLAMRVYDNTHGKLPPTTFGSHVESKGTAFVAILPFLEETHISRQWDWSVAATKSPNLELIDQPMPVYRCPSMVVRQRDGPGWPSSYALSTGSGYYRAEEDNGAFTEYEAIRPSGKCETWTSLARIGDADGVSHTFLIGELSYGLDVIGGFTQWAIGYPYHSAGSTAGVFDATDAGPQGLDFRTWETFRSDHPGHVNFVFCDGSVHPIPSETDATVLDNLANRKDGKAVGEY